MKVVRKEIDALCWFDKSGFPLPIRIRLENEDQEDLVIKIDKIISKSLERLAGNKMYVYDCKITLNNTEKIAVIKYSIDDCKWILFKI